MVVLEPAASDVQCAPDIDHGPRVLARPERQVRNPGLDRRDMETGSEGLPRPPPNCSAWDVALPGTTPHGHVDDLWPVREPHPRWSLPGDRAGGRQLRAAPRRTRAPAADAPRRRFRRRGRAAANARTASSSTAAAARQLRQLLHRQRHRAGSHVQRSSGSPGAGILPISSPARRRCGHPLRSTWCGAWARFTA